MLTLQKFRSTINRKNRRLISFYPLFIPIIWMAFSNPVYGMRLTAVKHLFDLTYNFNFPSDVAVSSDGKIYVVDGVNSAIKVFNQSGEYLFSFGREGSRDGEFRLPLGVGIDSSNKVYIADSGNHRIQIFNPGGGYLSKINLPSRKGKPADPTDVAVDDSRNRCYIVDNDNHYILVYDLLTLELLATYGSQGTDKLNFRYPFLIDLDKDKYLYVVDVINTRIQVLNPEGLFVSFIGGWGVEKGKFFRPKGIAIDKENRVYVSDSYMGVVQVFKTNGELLSAVGDSVNGKAKKFNTPVGLFVDDQNRLYVVEMAAQKVSVFHIGNDAE